MDQHQISALALLYRTLPGGFFEVMPHWIRGFSGLQNPFFNIFLPIDAAGLSDETLADTSAFFSSRNVLYAVELIHDRLPEGPDYLTDRRYQSLPPQPAMLLDGPPNQLSFNSDIVIERVATVPLLTAFCTLLHRVFDFSIRDMVKFFPAAYLKEDKIRLYLAFLNEQPVATGAVICTEGVATIRDMCTLDEYRGRGIATTLAHHMINDARGNGCPVAMLYSTAQAYHIFTKLGFEIYTQRQWFLPPDIDYEDER